MAETRLMHVDRPVGLEAAVHVFFHCRRARDRLSREKSKPSALKKMALKGAKVLGLKVADVDMEDGSFLLHARRFCWLWRGWD